jgi:D-alanyl-D-alanine carboxypeptidase
METVGPIQPVLSQVVGSLLDGAGAPGAAVALVVDGEPVLVDGIGSRDLGRAEPLGADERFYLYSVTKTLLAVAALRLVEEERLDLDGPIQATLPEVPLRQPVTVRQLLNHTGGLPDYAATREYADDLRADPGAPWTADEFLARTLWQGLRFPPGHGWAYSNIGYLLVRQAIERVARRSLREALSDLIFEPLGLRRTAVAETLDDTRCLAPGYTAELDRDGRLHDVSRRYHPGWVSHGVVSSSAPEVAQILEALFAGRLLGPALLAEMLEAVAVPGTHPMIAKPGYGLGLMVDLGSVGGRVAGHGGEGPGYSTAAFHFPTAAGHRLTSVALANRGRHDLGLGIAFALARAYADREGSSC